MRLTVVRRSLTVGHARRPTRAGSPPPRRSGRARNLARRDPERRGRLALPDRRGRLRARRPDRRRRAASTHVPGIAKVWPNLTYHSLSSRHAVRAAVIERARGDRRERSGARTSPPPARGSRSGSSTTASTRAIRSSTRTGFSYPPGFPKGHHRRHDAEGDRPARRSRRPSPTYEYADDAVRPVKKLVPRDPRRRDRGRRPRHAPTGRCCLSGVAPKAYLGNYKALTIPTPGFGLDGNSARDRRRDRGGGRRTG